VTRILVVDDEDDLRLVVRMVLETVGHDVDEADDGRAALERLTTAEPDLVLLDLRMPEIDGWEVLRRLQADGRLERLPILVLSAHIVPEVCEQVIALGARGYLAKPFSSTELLAAVEDLLAA
jgi:CheY-like chemotaxis protein